VQIVSFLSVSSSEDMAVIRRRSTGEDRDAEGSCTSLGVCQYTSCERIRGRHFVSNTRRSTSLRGVSACKIAHYYVHVGIYVGINCHNAQKFQAEPWDFHLLHYSILLHHYYQWFDANPTTILHFTRLAMIPQLGLVRSS